MMFTKMSFSSQHFSTFYQLLTIYVFLTLNLSVCLSVQHDIDQFPGLEDEIHALPDVNFIPDYRHYSGYLKSHNETYLHYWFFESKSSNPSKDPVVLWLNGGPGCSSLLGAVAESGPLTLNINGSIVENPNAWNQKANLLFLESPAGVGFSYQVDPPPGALPNDNQTAQLNFEALLSFYLKFPHLISNDFYLTGESYAGIYIPTLSMLILEQNFPVNFKGISIGNALLDHRLLYSSRLQFGHTHGMVPNSSWDNVTKHCCPVDYKTFRDCQLNNVTYDMIDRIEPSNCLNSFIDAMNHIHALPRNVFNIKETCVKRSAGGLCANESDHLIEWFNRLDVQQALKVYDPSKPSIQWIDCDDHILNVYVKNIVSVSGMMRHLLEKNIKVLLYFGDTDLVCNYISAEWFLDDLNLTNHDTIEATPWYFESKLTGYIKQYQEGLLYVKILDAGHEVLRFKPAPALKMFQDFVQVTSSSTFSSSSSTSSSNGFLTPIYLNSGLARRASGGTNNFCFVGLAQILFLFVNLIFINVCFE